MTWLLAGLAVAGVTVDPEGWPDDLALPTTSCVVPPRREGWTQHVVHLDGTLDTEGRFHTSFDHPSATVAAQCDFEPVVWEEQPVAVPVTLRVVHPAPPYDREVVVRLRGDGGAIEGLSLAVGDQVVVTDSEGTARFRNAAGEPIRPSDPRISLEEVDGVVWVTANDTWELVARYSSATDRAGTEVITVEELRLSPGTLQDPVRSVATRPGVVRTPFESGWLIVRGGDPGDATVAFDGVQLPILYHLGGFASVLPSHLVEEVRFWPGASPARYGDLLAGVMDVIPARPAKEPIAHVGANVVFAHAELEVPTSLGAVSAGVRRSYLDAVLRAAVGEERARIAPRFWDAHLRLAGKRHSVTLLALSDAIDAPTSAGDIVEIRQSGAQLQGRFDVPIPSGRLRITPWVSQWSRQLQGRSAPQRTSELSPGARLELQVGEKLKTRVGVEAEGRRYRIEQDTSRREAPGASVDPYVDVRFGDRVQVDAGTRLATLFVQGHLPRAGHAPRALVRWRASQAIAVHVGLSRSFRPPDPVLLVGLSDGAYLRLEQADALEMGVRFQHRWFTANATAWTRRMRSLADLEVDGSLGGQFGAARGFESQLVLEGEQAVLRAIYQYTIAERWEDEGDVRYPTPWDQPHRVQLVGLVQLPARWSVSGRFRFSSATPSPRVSQDAYDLLTGATTPLVADGGRLVPFVGLDLKLNRRFTSNRWTLDAFVDLQNLTNTRINEPIITGFGDTDPAYAKGLPFLPVLGVEAHLPLTRPSHDASKGLTGRRRNPAGRPRNARWRSGRARWR